MQHRVAATCSFGWWPHLGHLGRIDGFALACSRSYSGSASIEPVECMLEGCHQGRSLLGATHNAACRSRGMCRRCERQTHCLASVAECRRSSCSTDARWRPMQCTRCQNIRTDCCAMRQPSVKRPHPPPAAYRQTAQGCPRCGPGPPPFIICVDTCCEHAYHIARAC